MINALFLQLFIYLFILLTTSAAGFSGFFAGHLAGKIFSASLAAAAAAASCRLEEAQHLLAVLLIYFPKPTFSFSGSLGAEGLSQNALWVDVGQAPFECGGGRPGTSNTVSHGHFFTSQKYLGCWCFYYAIK